MTPMSKNTSCEGISVVKRGPYLFAILCLYWTAQCYGTEQNNTRWPKFTALMLRPCHRKLEKCWVLRDENRFAATDSIVNPRPEGDIFAAQRTIMPPALQCSVQRPIFSLICIFKPHLLINKSNSGGDARHSHRNWPSAHIQSAILLSSNKTRWKCLAGNMTQGVAGAPEASHSEKVGFK